MHRSLQVVPAVSDCVQHSCTMGTIRGHACVWRLPVVTATDYIRKCMRWPDAFCRIGLSDEVGADTVRIYCPRCTEVYVPPAGTKGAAVDGAYFGTGLPHMVFMTRPEYTPLRFNDRYVAKLYGFRVHDSAYDLQRHEGNEQRRSVQQRAGSTSAAMTTSAGNRAKNSTVTSSILGTTSTAHRLTPPARHHKL